jgi:fructokinase
MFLVCGEALFDVFVTGAGARGDLSLDARVGGSPFNVAVGLARLGTSAGLLTGISNDVFGERLVASLERERVATDYLVRSGRRTTLSVVGLGEDGSPAYTFYGVGSADCSLTASDLPILRSNIAGLHFGSYSIAVAPVADAFLSLARSNTNRFISLDPNVRLNVEPDVAVWNERIAALLPHTSLVKVSAEDLELLAPGQSADDVARAWLSRGPVLVIVTDGANGATAWTNAHRTYVAAAKIAVIDTVGAGDAFQAAILHQLLARGTPSRATLAALDDSALNGLLATAITAAGIACTRRGADLPTAADLAAAKSFT